MELELTDKGSKHLEVLDTTRVNTGRYSEDKDYDWHILTLIKQRGNIPLDREPSISRTLNPETHIQGLVDKYPEDPDLAVSYKKAIRRLFEAGYIEES